MYVNFSPYFIQTPYISIRYYGLMYFLGLILAYIIFRRFYKNTDLQKKEIFDFIMYAFIGGIIGARFFMIFIYNWQYYSQNFTKILYIWEGGLSFHGGILGGVLGGGLYCLIHKKKKWLQLFDLSMLAIIPTIALVRIGGNFINMELYGREANVPWCMRFSSDPDLLCRHPSQLYEGFLEGAMLFFIVYLVYIHYHNYKGLSAIIFFIVYSLFRFILEFFREPDVQLGYFFGWMTMGQILSSIMLSIGILCTYFYIVNINKK